METKNSFISSANVKVQGRTAYYKMLEAVRQGELIQVCRGVYANIDQLSACMVDIESIVPNGILCLWSAWNIHQLTTSMPQAYHVAIKRDRKVTMFANANAMTTVGRRSLEALRLQPLGKPPQCFS